ncbi:unnamed protein product, partial [Didymodactylos carnosus]
YTTIYQSKERVTKHTGLLTYFDYKKLQTKYSDNLKCPCSHQTISYKTFLSISPTFHQLCSSDFISDEWLDYLSNTIDDDYFFLDFRKYGQSFFQALSTLCKMVRKTVFDALAHVRTAVLVSPTLITKDSFLLETDAFIDLFKTQTKRSFLKTFSLIRHTFHSNRLLSGTATSSVPFITDGNIHLPVNYVYFVFPDKNQTKCSCDSSLKCAVQLNLYSTSLTRQILFKIHGLYISCYPIGSVLYSSFETFYNQTSIDELQSYINSTSPITVVALNSSLPTKYSQNTTMENILNELMIEQWHSDISYENYYNQCLPFNCTYTYVKRWTNLMHAIVNVIETIDGLSTVLIIITPSIIKLILRIKDPRTRESGK